MIAVGGYAPSHTSHGRALTHFADRLRGHGVDVDVMWNILDQGRPNTDLFEMVDRGELTWCFFSTSYLVARVPALAVLDVPYLFHDLDAAHRALDGKLGEHLAAETLRLAGMAVLGFWDNGFRHFTNDLRPVHGPGDVSGMRVRLQPNELHVRLIEAWGGIPVPVELSEAIALIRGGEVDAQENPLANTAAYAVDTLHGHVTMTGHLYGARGIFANPAALAALPGDVREALDVAVRDAITFQRAAAAEDERRLRHRMERNGVAFVDLTDAERAQFVDASNPAIEFARSSVDPTLLGLAAA